MYDEGGGEMSVWWFSANATVTSLIKVRMTKATAMAFAGKV